MKQQKAILTPKGMQKDTSVTVFSSEYAFDIKNMRFTATDENSFMCLTNEKSNIKVPIYKKDTSSSGNSLITQLSSLGTILGVQSLSDYCIVFRKVGDSDIISKLTYEDSKLYIQNLYEGNLKFNTSNPIESIGIYETENIHKVYWVDGINQPRVINPSEEGIKKIKENNDSQFDFIPITYSDNNNIKVDIQKKKHYSGLFPAGVIQYAISYFNTNLQESNIIYQSSLLYTSSTNRGTSAEDTSSDVFEITIEGLNKNFEYVKIYRILRTSIDAVPSVELVGEYKTTSTFRKDDKEVEGIYVIDSGTTGSTIDPTSLLYLGGEPIYPKAITHKDNTLFLGNITLNNPTISNKNKEYIKNNSEVWFDYIDTEIPDEESDLNTQYLYVNNLDKKSNEITFFQKGETYRVGVQLLYATGNWSEVIYLGDFKNDKRVVVNNYNDSIKKKPIIKANINLPNSIADKYVAARLVCVYPSFNEREVLCQGLVLPTVYNVKDRLDNTPYAQSSWFARPSYYNIHKYYDYIHQYPHNNSKNMSIWKNNYKGFPLEFRMCDQNQGIYFLPSAQAYNSECMYSKNIDNNGTELPKTTSLQERLERSKFYHNDFGVDKTIVTFHSPEMDLNYDDKIYNTSLDGVKFRVVGYVPVKTNYSKLELYYSNPFDPTIGGFYWNTIEDPSNTSHISGLSLPSFPFWVDALAIKKEDTAPNKVNQNYWYASFPIYPWHKTGPLNNQGKIDEGSRKSILDQKFLSNLRIGLPTKYLNDDYTSLNISNIELIKDSLDTAVHKLKVWGKDITYKGTINTVLTTKNTEEYPYYINAYMPSKDLESLNYKGVRYDPQDLINNSPYSDPEQSHYTNINEIGDVPVDNINKYALDSIPIQYKSSQHAVFAFEKDNQGLYTLLPAITSSNQVLPIIVGNVIFKISSSENQIIPVEDTTEDGVKYIGASNANLNYFIAGINYIIETPHNWEIKNVKVYAINKGYTMTENDNEGGNIYHYVSSELQHNNEILDFTGPKHSTLGYYINFIPSTEEYNKLVFSKKAEESYYIHCISGIEVTIYNPVYKIYKTVPMNIGKINWLYDEGKCKEGTITQSIDSDVLDIIKNESYTNEKPSNNLWWEGVNEDFKGFYQHSIIVDDPVFNDLQDDLFYFVVGELYKESIPNKFGGNSVAALTNNKWIPCGPIKFFDSSTTELYGDQGDTYFQRYDLLKTIPYSENCINNIVDITSFCCETRINIDGRYDRNRGLQDNTYITPNNFNLFNKVYSQQNNFFIQQYLDSEKFNSKNFSNQVTWSKTKTLGEEIDTWTNINLANILDLDGDKGDLQKLLKFNNNIYAIQDRGVSAINFNPRVQINTSDGVPIEISNGGKVDGKIYISEKYGTTNKWSVVETPSGFYFVDGTNQEILACNGKEFSSLTMTNKMYSWLKDKDTSSVWSPVNTKAIRALYDSKNKDIYFTNDYEALSFSELSSTFTSRYSYGSVGWLFNFDNDTYQVYSKHSNNSIWKLHGGDDYGYFFDEDKQNPLEYSIEYIVNDNFPYDKMFDTVELLTNDIFTADRTGNMYPFNTLQTQNEYQESIAYSSSMKKKFRIWRWPIGRNNRGAFPSRDRIRNTWIKLKLAGNQHNKIQLYNTSVIYYV